MKQCLQSVVILSAVVFVLGACGKKGEDSGKKPPKPSDGTPVAAQFLSLTGSGDKLAAKMKLHNYVDKKIRRVVFNLRYLDGTGKELKTFPWSQSSGQVVKANGSATLTVGAFLPAETKTVDAVPRIVDFADGTKWERKKK